MDVYHVSDENALWDTDRLNDKISFLVQRIVPTKLDLHIYDLIYRILMHLISLAQSVLSDSVSAFSVVSYGGAQGYVEFLACRWLGVEWACRWRRGLPVSRSIHRYFRARHCSSVPDWCCYVSIVVRSVFLRLAYYPSIFRTVLHRAARCQPALVFISLVSARIVLSNDRYLPAMHGTFTVYYVTLRKRQPSIAEVIPQYQLKRIWVLGSTAITWIYQNGMISLPLTHFFWPHQNSLINSLISESLIIVSGIRSLFFIWCSLPKRGSYCWRRTRCFHCKMRSLTLLFDL